jgi:hypothetical protein
MTLPPPAAQNAQVAFAGGAIMGALGGLTIVIPTKGLPMSKPTTSEYIRGSLYGLAAVSIWAGWIVAVRLGIRTSLAPWDIVAIRFGVAGLILLPYLLKKGLAVNRLGWRDWRRSCWAVGHRWC